MSALRFAVIGINHDHIFGQIVFMLDAGAEFSTFLQKKMNWPRPLQHATHRRAALPTGDRSLKIHRLP